MYYDHRAHRSEAESLLVKARSKTVFLLYGDEFQRALRAKVACVLWLSCLVAQQNSLFQQKFTHMQFRPLLFLQTCLDALLTAEELNRVENSAEDKAVPGVALVFL